MNKKELHKFNNRFNSFALAFEQLKKAQHRNSIDKSITINEVHLIDLIGRNQPVNLVKLSEILEVSRSAITQSVRRLTKKDLVSFEFAPDNEKNKYLILSKKGVDVFNIHKEQQEHIEKAIFSVLRNYSDEDPQTDLSSRPPAHGHEPYSHHYEAYRSAVLRDKSLIEPVRPHSIP